MRTSSLAIVMAGALSLGACTSTSDTTLKSAGTGAAIGAGAGAVAGALIPGVSPVAGALGGAVVGAIAGTIAADKDGDGRADGYYQDGTYYPYQNTAPATSTPTYRSGERG